jgi:hypothetical protein
MGSGRLALMVALCSIALLLSSCLARRRVITRGRNTPTQTLLKADKQTLLNLVSKEYAAIQTINATVDMVPAIGSANKGKITEYKDVRAYILYRKPAEIRIIGLYPVVRNKAFDMTSNGKEFRLYVPAKNRFIEGPTAVLTPSPNKLENLRPSVFLDALLVQPVNLDVEFAVLEDFTDEDNAAYIVHVLYKGEDGDLHLERDIWFDRLSLHIARQILFDPQGEILTDARYNDWKTYDNVPFPRIIDINRPKDEYGVVITVVKMDINKPVGQDKFVLEQPEGTVLQVLGTKPAEQPAPADPPAVFRKKQKK